MTKNDLKWVAMMVSDRYQKKYSHNPVHTWCVHLLGECPELIRFWAMLALWWPKNDWKWWGPTNVWKSIHAIRFKLGVYNYWVSVQNWFGFGPHWPNFGPLVATKWLKMVVSDHYLAISVFPFPLIRPPFFCSGGTNLQCIYYLVLSIDLRSRGYFDG